MKTPPRISSELPIIGFPGQNGIHVVVPIFPEGDARNTGGPAGLPGEYEVVFTLHRPGYPLQPERVIVSGDRLEGDSHLEIPAVFRIDADVEGKKFTFEGKPNSRKFLASFTCRLHSAGIREAQEVCYKALTPILSNFALRWDVPIAIYQIDVKELRRGTLQITSRNPFNPVAIKGQFIIGMSPELKAYAAIYREALTTESITYQFLCYFRLIESIQARRRRLGRDAARRGEVHEPLVEIYPRDVAEAEKFLDSILPVKPSKWDQMTLDAVLVTGAIGNTFKAIIKDQLNPIRVNIAHTILQRSEELVSMDDVPSRARVELWLPPAKCITRAMIKNDFGALLG